jgi:hypothetical protein
MSHTCLQCGTSFDLATRKDNLGTSKKFCSYSCHNKYYRSQRKHKNLSGANHSEDDHNGEHITPLSSSLAAEAALAAEEQSNTPKVISAKPVKPISSMKDLGPVSLAFNDLPPAARFIISTLQSDISELKADKRDLATKVETITEERNKLKEELREIVLKKPSTLEGLSDSPIVKELIPHIGPALGNLINSFVNGKSATGMAGISGAESVSEETNQMLALIAQWFVSVDEAKQKMFFNLTRGLSEKSPEEQDTILKQLLNLIFNGVAFDQPGNKYGTASY